MSGIHGHGRDLAHAGCRPGGQRLRAGSHQVVERRSTLNERVQSFLYTRVVKIDTWSGGGRSLTTWCDLHAARRGAITLGCTWSRAGHGWAGWVLGRGWAEGAVALCLGDRGRANSAGRCPTAAVKQAEDFSLQLLLIAGISWGTRTSRQAEVAGLWECVSSWGLDVMVCCCSSWSCGEWQVQLDLWIKSFLLLCSLNFPEQSAKQTSS